MKYKLTGLIHYFRKKQQERLARLDAQSVQKGYDFAAGELLRGRDADSLEAETDRAGSPSPFRYGVLNAVNDWRERQDKDRILRSQIPKESL